MNPTERYIKTKDVLSKFPSKGEKEYQESALFHQVVQMLVSGVDTYAVIEQLINTTENIQHAFEQHLISNTRTTPLIKP